jgi:hypothetical protein
VSSAYCMTCNDQVLDLAGSCPEGHPIGGEDLSPEPWVGHANASGSSTPSPPPPPPPPPAAPPTAQAGHVNGSGAVNGSAAVNGFGAVNGSAASNGSGAGHEHVEREAMAHQVTSFTPAASDVDGFGGRAVHRAPATGEAADELAAMLASALSSSPDPAGSTVDPAPSAPQDQTASDLDGPWVGSTNGHGNTPTASGSPTPPWTDADLDDFLAASTAAADAVADTAPPPAPEAADNDWADLASLAAELRLDDANVDALPPPPPAPETQLPASDSLVDLPPPAPAAPAPAVPAPAPPAPAAVAPAAAEHAVDAYDTGDLDILSDQDLAALYESAVAEHLDEADHVPSEPTTPLAPQEAAAPAVTVDLANFTARGNPVSRNSAASRRFGRKR